MVATGFTLPAQALPCPQAALSQVVRHRTEAGETLSTVAAEYGLLPTTLIAMNPNLPAQGALPVGQVIEVPPFNGVVAQVEAGQTWQSLAERHGTRADLLFEINGCPDTLPRRVFIPGSNQIVADPVSISLRYPLPAPAKLILSYGWQPHPQRDELVFNSGIALEAMPETEVMAAADGIVASVGENNGTLMVVVNHRNGLQTRYGNLENVALRVGDAVSEGSRLGTVAGRASESFMYFEVRINSNEGWVARNPGLYLAELSLQ
ncbi:LysM peptidoglycan-binding domain-containing M23 family metallopeptidase [Leptolyngbya sp. Heron Island J]|uniref:LysM peptidoglycan-binding domain-containing M23 family metallopeptidase n=1 Tax=Leptolyngbya sp. Heron Island J TaxID=1385935 RepID=UPI000414C16D|nr:M23 family metallopeptidase [Leptolyngbya sp. Heron Island J]